METEGVLIANHDGMLWNAFCLLANWYGNLTVVSKMFHGCEGTWRYSRASTIQHEAKTNAGTYKLPFGMTR